MGDEVGAFEAHVAVGVDEGGDDVGIEGVGADADGVAGVDAALAAEVFLAGAEALAFAAGCLAVDLAAMVDGLSGWKNERAAQAQKGRGNRAERGPVNGAAALS